MPGQKLFPANLYDEEIYLIPAKGGNVEQSETSQKVSEPEAAYSTAAGTVVVIAEEALSPTSEELLSKILAAINVSQNEFSLELTATADIPALLNNDNYSLVLAFLDENALAANGMSSYAIQEINSGQLVGADPLSVLQTDVQKKRKLWECLKSLKRS